MAGQRVYFEQVVWARTLLHTHSETNSEWSPTGKRVLGYHNENQIYFRLGLLFPIDIGGLISVERCSGIATEYAGCACESRIFGRMDVVLKLIVV